MHKAKKSYGQHFLVSEDTAATIASYIDHLNPGTNLAEVGPGRGMLTKYLMTKPFNLMAVEADEDMEKYLLSHYPQLASHILRMDFLKVNMSKLFEGQSFVIIGNFPYNISSQIVFKMINSVDLVPEMVGMFQKEMAERIIAGPGGKDYGIISVLAQAYYEGEMLMKLPPAAFNPPPKVNSAVIRLVRKQNYELGCNARLFRTIVKQSFGQRRKMLRNTLKNMVENPDVLSDVYFNQRPEQLSVQEFIHLTNKIQNHIKHEPRDENHGGPQGSDESEGPGSDAWDQGD
ncbi:MAG: ribosomal RNA small subunit methyltransferase A [Saprospiraceae bacterium]|nr:ribosomal RNA small subunit methyltransferase A [Saprospiraceae bacterium]